MIKKAKRKLTKNQKGFSLVEMMLASTVMMVVVGGSISLQSNLFQLTTQNNDRTFAAEKAAQMFEELRAFVLANRETDISKLQNFSDGSGYNEILTTEKKEVVTSTGTVAVDLENPGDPLSGNRQSNGSSWRFTRQIQVKPVASDPNARYVTVSVWYADPDNGGQPSGVPLASIAGVLKTNITADPPTQVYDLYLIASENSPSWWSDLSVLKPTFERTLADLEQRNPGLTFRRHFINKTAFGRDPYYIPYLNSASAANSQAIPWSYYYVGKVSSGNRPNVTEGYVADNIKARIRTDAPGRIHHIDRTKPSYGSPTNLAYNDYTLADQFNHALRFPEQMSMERRLIDQDPSTFKDNISLVTFLHRLNEGVLKNAIVVNMHGELLPLPPLRNYSDPAKAPDKFAKRLDANPTVDGASHPGNVIGDSQDSASANGTANFVSLAYKRVVSHPENLRYDNNSTVNWRVYAYEEIPPGKSRLTRFTDADAHRMTLEQREESIIPVTSLFIPTIGEGPNYKNAEIDGYLTYPDFEPPSVIPSGAFTIRKMLGSDNQQYTWLNNTTSNDRFAENDGTPHSDALFIANPVSGLSTANRTTAALLSIPTQASSEKHSQSLVFENVRTADFTSTRQNELINALITLSSGAVDSSGKSLREVVRIRSIALSNYAGSGSSQTARVTIGLNRQLENDHSGIARINVNGSLGNFTLSGSTRRSPVTLHKHYDLESVNTNMYGAPHRGIRVKLYDTPTRHPLHPDENKGGLRDERRLYGLEYIPAPVTNESGTPSFTRDLTDTTRDNVKNTARWRVSMNTSQFGNNFSYTGTTDENPDISPVLALETRMLTSDYDRQSPVDVPNCSSSSNTSLRELCDGIWGDGDAYVPNLTSTSVDEHKTQMRPNLYNVSRTYIYMNRNFTDRSANDWPSQRIPKIEQAQFIGHPLYNPYLDAKALHRYNRHEIHRDNILGSASGFDRATGAAWDGNNVDLNWFLNLYSHGIMRSNAIYNSITGFSNYYYSFGGEIGSDGNNADYNVNNQPWRDTDNSGVSSTSNNDGLINEITNSARVISSTDTPNNSLHWRQRINQGEMFPDNEFNFWKENGNLPTHDFVNATHNAAPAQSPAPILRYFRKQGHTSGDTFATPSSSHRRLATTGAPTFVNGSHDPIGNQDAGLAHDSVDGTARLTSGAGRYVVNAFNLNLQDTVEANRPFRLNGGAGSGGYTTAEFRSLRNRLRFINTTTGSLSATNDANNTYYDHNSNTSRISSAMIRLARPNPSSTGNDIPGFVGYALVNGLRNAGETGLMGMARFTQAASLQTYMDAGDRSIPGALPGRSVQIPRIQITSPQAANIQIDPSNVTVNFEIDWRRWDGEKYSPAYPNNWYDQVPLVFNVKYSPDNKRTWKYADNHESVPFEYIQKYNPAHTLGAAAAMTGPNVTKTFTWNAASLEEGNYVFRVECHRQGYLDVGYSYHDVFLTIER